jgi:uncharacterized membrane protein YoaK (UPF0700 family)
VIEQTVEYIRSEPVRVRAYSAIVLVAVYLCLKGYVQPSDVEFLTTLAALVLGVENARDKVSPARKRKR